MCADAPGAALPAGPHARVEQVAGDGDGSQQLRLTIDVPFELQSMAEAELDVGATSVHLRGPAPACDEVKVPLPNGLALDPEQASARYSRKKRQLVISSPAVARAASVDATIAETVPLATPSADASSASIAAASATSAPARSAAAEPPLLATSPAAQLVEAPKRLETTLQEVAVPASTAEDDADDDDCPPPLDAVRRATPKPATPLRLGGATPEASATAAGIDSTNSDHVNEASEALMKKALAAHEQKRRETEEAHRKADITSSGVLKKGFLSGSKAKRSPPKPDKRQQAAEEIPYIAGAGDPEAARQAGLQLPEVQKALKQGAQQLKEDTSWVTPQLMQALASRPDLSQAMSNPRIQEAIQLMQADPQAAQRKYKDDKEISTFLQEFMSLMATHFDVLSKEAPTPSRASTGKPAPQALPASAPAAAPSARPPRPGEIMSGEGTSDLPIADPKIAALLQDPEVLELIGALRAGRPLELHDLARSNERLFMKVKVLLDNGLLNLQR